MVIALPAFIRRISVAIALTLCCTLTTSFAAGADDQEQPIVLCGTDAGFDLQSLNILSGTGTLAIDRALVQELMAQSRFFRVRPAFFVYSGGIQNALATPEVFPQTPGTDGTILYQLDLLTEHLNSAYFGGSIVAGVIAHEFTHIIQFSDRDLYSRLSKAHSTVKFLELHADFVAGYYMGTKFSHRSEDLETLARKIFELGDNNFTNIGHHGTPQERHVALRAGFRYYVNNPNSNITAALVEGEAFVTSVFPDF
ncbi:hypothetical protein [Roseovarius pelagicus]|uniref:Neutral zinc metallopeptidase n=1 Tax=Roseovarius pelagicus TaxID=2980108 RepID=A0ABY6DEG9_9RHOB|nr:hypothetical protein [Roseovarius pelagicus]UXX84547.1 hypothetical protein N7U68_07875 [Roseovarius pelagicus]